MDTIYYYMFGNGLEHSEVAMMTDDRRPPRNIDPLDMSSSYDDIFKSMVFIKDNEIKLLKEKLLAKDSQITTLKAALIDDRSELILCGPSYSLWRYQNSIDRIESQEDWKPIEAKAKEELAQEYPDIFKEE